MAVLYVLFNVFNVINPRSCFGLVISTRHSIWILPRRSGRLRWFNCPSFPNSCNYLVCNVVRESSIILWVCCMTISTEKKRCLCCVSILIITWFAVVCERNLRNIGLQRNISTALVVWFAVFVNIPAITWFALLKHTYTHRHTDTQTHRHTDTQTHRHTHTHTHTHNNN